MTTPTPRQHIEQLARQANRENNTSMALEAIAAADELSATLKPHAGISLRLFTLDLRATWDIAFFDAFQSTVLALESSSLSDFDKKGHRRALAAIARRSLSVHPELQQWLDNADLTVTDEDTDTAHAS